MKRLLTAVAVVAVLVFGATPASAGSITVAVGLDTAPNAYGSPLWPGFRDAAYANLVASTFVDQAHSTDPANIGTWNYALADAVVYSFGDLGKRLHQFYYVPGETTASLTAINFQVKLSYEWDGVWYDAYDWLTPSSWIDGSGGVLGSMGMAWWGAYGVNTPEALAADMAAWAPYPGQINFQMRWDGGSVSNMAYYSPVPEPGTLVLLGLGLLGGAARLRRTPRRP